jgi:hypothetical protein
MLVRAIDALAQGHGALDVQTVICTKVASSASRTVKPGPHAVRTGVAPEVGNVVAVRVVAGYAGGNVLELGNGRLASLKPGDTLAAVLGNRQALKGYVGAVPPSLAAGDVLQILNLGGVVGVCQGGQHGLGAPTSVEYLGTLYEHDAPVNIRRDALHPAVRLTAKKTPLVLVAGTCMNSGKTRAAAELVGRFTQSGRRVAAAKLTGVACLRDLLLMEDLGAVGTLSFLDCGLPSTVGLADAAPLAKAIVNRLAEDQPDVIVMELGDGLLGGYGVASVFRDPEIVAATAGLVVCANDYVGAWGAIQWLAAHGVRPDVIAGSATDSADAVHFIESQLGAPAANALGTPERFFNLIASRVVQWTEQHPSRVS